MDPAAMRAIRRQAQIVTLIYVLRVQLRELNRSPFTDAKRARAGRIVRIISAAKCRLFAYSDECPVCGRGFAEGPTGFNQVYCDDCDQWFAALEQRGGEA